MFKIIRQLPDPSVPRIRTPVILLTGKLEELFAAVDDLAEQSYDPLTASLEDHHLEEHDDGPGKDAAVVRDDRQVVEIQANVGEQGYHEDEYDRQDGLVVHVVRVP